MDAVAPGAGADRDLLVAVDEVAPVDEPERNAAAAAGAGLAIWKLTKPVQDPWTAPVPGPITANIPVVQEDGLVNPYAKQEQAVAEARLAGQTGQGPTVVVQQGPGAR